MLHEAVKHIKKLSFICSREHETSQSIKTFLKKSLCAFYYFQKNIFSFMALTATLMWDWQNVFDKYVSNSAVRFNSIFEFTLFLFL